MGYYEFVDGQIATATILNEYLSKQVVMVFPDSSARTAALSGVLQAGMISYLTGTDEYEKYDGATWVTWGARIPNLLGRVTSHTNYSGTTPVSLFSLPVKAGAYYLVEGAIFVQSQTNGDLHPELEFAVPSGGGLDWFIDYSAPGLLRQNGASLNTTPSGTVSGSGGVYQVRGLLTTSAAGNFTMEITGGSTYSGQVRAGSYLSARGA